MTNTVIPKKPRADGQLTALSGEFFVAAELLRRGLQCSVTFGNAKAIDLLAYNPANKKSYQVQVKALRKKTYFPIGPSDVLPNCIYVFVILNTPGQPVEYFIIPGTELLADTTKFGTYFGQPRTFPGIEPNSLKPYRDNWKLFEV